MSGFFNRLGQAQNASNAASDTQNKLQSQQLANAINALSLKKQQVDQQAASLAGNYAAQADPGAAGFTAPPAPPQQPPQQPQQTPPPMMPGSLPMPPGMQGLPSSGQAMPNIPQVNSSQLQPPPSGASPQMQQPGMAQLQQQAGVQPPQQQPAAPPAGGPQQGQQAPWWRTAAASIKKQNPDASGDQIMAAIEKLTPLMTQQNKQDFENFKLHVEQQQKQGQLEERERSDQSREALTGRGQDLTAEARAAALEQRASAAEARVKELEANRSERGREADQTNDTRLKSIAQKITTSKKSGTDPAYKALQDEYKTTAAAQRSMMNNPGMYTDEQKAEMEQKVDALQKRVDAFTQPSSGSAPAEGTASGGRVNVMKDGKTYSLPPEQLDEALKQGYTRAQ